MSKESEEAEIRAKERYEKILQKYGLTIEEVNQMKKNVKRDSRGKVICDRTKPSGSIENPLVVGMPDCSDHLVFDYEKNRWILTDGLGNGWIR